MTDDEQRRLMLEDHLLSVGVQRFATAIARFAALRTDDIPELLNLIEETLQLSPPPMSPDHPIDETLTAAAANTHKRLMSIAGQTHQAVMNAKFRI